MEVNSGVLVAIVLLILVAFLAGRATKPPSGKHPSGKPKHKAANLDVRDFAPARQQSPEDMLSQHMAAEAAGAYGADAAPEDYAHMVPRGVTQVGPRITTRTGGWDIESSALGVQ